MINAYNFAKSVYDYEVLMRRHFHKFPELGGVEEATYSRLIIELKKMNIEYDTLEDYSIIAYLNKNSNKKAIALRCLMDALPLEEKTNLEFKSVNNNITHSLGNDMSMAIGLGVLKALKSHEHEINKQVIVFFESDSTNYAQSKRIVESGLLKNVEFLYTLYGSSNMESDKAYINPNQKYVGTEYLNIKWHGESAPAGYANGSADALLAAATFVSRLRGHLAYSINPEAKYAAIVSQLNGGFYQNVTADFAQVSINTRYDSTQTKSEIHKALATLTNNVEAMFSVKSSTTVGIATKPFSNDKEASLLALRALENQRSYVSLDKDYISMYSPSFSNYIDHYKSALLTYGINNPLDKTTPLFTASYNPDEKGMLVATAWFIEIVKEFLLM